ncbi:hypothetical protein QBC38DRAFT_474092, partial [Podospora fimiseda]
MTGKENQQRKKEILHHLIHQATKKSPKMKFPLDVGLIRTDAPEGTRFLVLRIRPLCHHA